VAEDAGDLDLSGKRCLVVDDIDINREIILELLADTHISMETAVNGQDALDMFCKSKVSYYDIILMDMQMPIMDGCTATQEIRKQNRPDAQSVSIIAMTANVMEDDIRKVKDAGMNGHLGKPIDMQAVYKIFREQLGKADG
jgi:CheY-like chemotaxis protein